MYMDMSSGRCYALEMLFVVSTKLTVCLGQVVFSVKLNGMENREIFCYCD
jgi:hypothetical protein